MKDINMSDISRTSCISQFSYTFIYSLLNYVFSISDCIASNEKMRNIVKSELERMLKEAVVA